LEPIRKQLSNPNLGQAFRTNTQAKKIRLDQLLVDRGLTQTRTKAQALIISGSVRVVDETRLSRGEVVITKPGTKVSQSLSITLAPINRGCPYVSRGGVKLAGAIAQFNIEVRNKVALDIGASTGGFTDCLLQRGCKKVYAIDVGYGQLDPKLRAHPQVNVRERTNARYLNPADFPERMDLAVIDVSFISLKKIFPAVVPLLKETAEIIALVKPQFEIPKSVGKKKGGVVRDPKLREAAVRDIAEFATKLGLAVVGVVPSVLTGPAGNQEYFIYMKKKDSDG